MITASQAQQNIFSQIFNPGTENVPVANSFDRILAQDYFADQNYPSFMRVCMDGIAVKFPLNNEWKLSGIQAAGSPPMQLSATDICIEVMTGGVLPIGADLVIPYEDTKQIENHFTYTPRSAPLNKAFANVAQIGSDYKKGDLLLKKGTKIRAPEIGILASIGVCFPEVIRIPKIAIVSTGDELVDPSTIPLSYQMRRSNDIALQSSLNAFGFINTSCFALPDNKVTISNLVQKYLQEFDVIITIGGVSKGKFDWVYKILPVIGVKEIFHGVKQKPGKPLWFGTVPNKLVFGLPGNPMSALINLHRYVIPALQKSMNNTTPYPQITIQNLPESLNNFTNYYPVKFNYARNSFERISHNGSGDYFSLHHSDGFIEASNSDSHTYYSWSPLGK